jgi:hypothetical protein
VSGMTRRLCLKLAVSLLSAGLALLTLAWPDWLELLLRVDPDGGNGAVEWSIVALFALVTLIGLALAHREWRRLRSAHLTG